MFLMSNTLDIIMNAYKCSANENTLSLDGKV